MIRIDDPDLSLIDFCPESIASDPEIIALCLAVDPELRSVGQAIIEAVIMPNIANLPEAVLDQLAWGFKLLDLQIWDVATTAGKQALLVNILSILKRSGTLFSIVRVFGLLSVTGEVVEWFEEGAPAYTYRIRLFVVDQPITLDQLYQVGELVHRFAPTRASLREFALEASPQGTALLYAAVTVGRQTTISFRGAF